MGIRYFITSMLTLVIGLVLTGTCYAGTSTQETINKTCTSKNANALIRSGYHQKVDNFLIIQDASSSMGEKLGDSSTKFAYSKGRLNCLNDTLPDNFNVNAGLRGFGFVTADKGLVYGMDNYTKAGLAGGVKAVTGTAGVTPLAKALNYGSMDLKGTSGPTAVILFSDGINTVTNDPIAAADAMKNMYPDLCIYTVLIGDSPQGKTTMEQIADASKCGFATDSSTIGNASGMDKFVTDVFLTTQERMSMTLLIQFDFDKDDIKSMYHDDIAKVAKALNANPGSKAQLEGHTDNMGPDSYNMSLSKRRAASVKKYLVEKFNIKASRLSTVGYGESKPVATNDTAAGKYKNRRVVVNFN